MENFLQIEDDDVDEELRPVPDSSNSRVSDFLFATALNKCGRVLLKKDQTPATKSRKALALKEVADFIMLTKGICITEQQIAKKLNNMKARVKSKTDMNRTGNRKSALNAGETLFLDILGNEDNPSVFKAKYGVSVGIAGAEELPDIQQIADPKAGEENLPSTSKFLANKKKPEEKTNLIDLQQLVLKKQLEVFDAQMNMFKKLDGVLNKIERFVDLRTNDNVEAVAMRSDSNSEKRLGQSEDTLTQFIRL